MSVETPRYDGWEPDDGEATDSDVRAAISAVDGGEQASDADVREAIMEIED